MHGDIKLSNLVVDEALNPFVLDVETVIRLTGPHALKRVPAGFRYTEGYAPPELAQHSLVCADTDLFSLGVTMQRIAEAVWPMAL